ncbi:MAG: hypothetical protein IPM91_01030 [Bacteroidetes bacterium]|nr:hypothetical protein [Bacteroidota bacterium]
MRKFCVVVTNFSSQKDSLKYGWLSALFAFSQGSMAILFHLPRTYLFFIPAPIAAFFVNYLLWHWTFKEKADYTTGNVISIGIIGIPVIHYFTFLLMGFGRIICYRLTGNCTDYTGQPDSIPLVLVTSVVQMLIAIYKTGIITFPMGIAIGIYVLKTSKVKNTEISK